MYIPKHFEIADKEEALSYVSQNSFGELVSTIDGKLFATHLPFLLSKDKSKLIGHFAKPNPQWEKIESQEVLAIFMDTHAYVSPQWYSAPGVPTWNYQAVHIYGKCTLFQEPDRLKLMLNELTEKHEAFQTVAWQPEYNESMLNGIVGVEIDIAEIQCKYKLNQNKPAEDRAVIAKQLAIQGNKKLSAAMKRNEK